nr:uncharacterized protein LOC117223381 [Megalopta genalis]
MPARQQQVAHLHADAEDRQRHVEVVGEVVLSLDVDEQVAELGGRQQVQNEPHEGRIGAIEDPLGRGGPRIGYPTATNAEKIADVQRCDVDAVELDGHHGAAHHHQNHFLLDLVELRPVHTLDYVRDFDALADRRIH